MSVKNEIFKKIDSFKDEMIKLQIDLTAIPAISPVSGGKGEWRKGEFLKGYLSSNGFGSLVCIDAPDQRAENGVRPNFFVKIKGRNPGKTVWVMSHLDIVPPGDLKLWKGDPYKVRIEEGKLIGRGTEDNQQGLVASIFAAKALKSLDITPQYDTGLLFVSDEENGSKFGIQHIIKTSPEIFGKDDLFIIPDAGEPDGSMIEVAEKSICWIKFTTKGKQCHGSMPHLGRNAFKAASHLVCKLNGLYKEFPLEDPLFDPPISTFEATKKEANVENINTIPGEDVFYMDSRILPSIGLKEVLARIDSYCAEVGKEFDVEITRELVQTEEAAPPTPADSEVVLSLRKWIKEAYGVEAKVKGIGGGTVAAYLRRLGLQAAVWSRLDEMAHQPEEYCMIDNMIGDAKVFACVMAFL